MKLPAIQFYVGDWLRDPISGCSLEAQGLWLRIMFIMHDNEDYGRLTVNGKPMPSQLLARRCGSPLDEFERVFQELDDAGVPSRDEAGIIYSRRMVRDAKTRAGNRERVARFRGSNHTGEESEPLTSEPRAKSERKNTPKRPKTFDAVAEYAAPQGVRTDEARAFWDYYDSQGWCKANGMPVLNWKSLLNQWKRRGETMGKRETNGKPVSVGSVREQQKSSEADINRIKLRTTKDWQTGNAVYAADGDKDELTQLRAKLKEIKGQIRSQ